MRELDLTEQQDVGGGIIMLPFAIWAAASAGNLAFSVGMAAAAGGVATGNAVAGNTPYHEPEEKKYFPLGW